MDKIKIAAYCMSFPGEKTGEQLALVEEYICSHEAFELIEDHRAVDKF